jgi:hypothetical protein
MSDFDDDMSFDELADVRTRWLLTAPTEELIRVLANGGDARWCWARQLMKIRRLDTIEVAPWA